MSELLLPQAPASTRITRITPAEDAASATALYRWMRLARCLDEIERELVARGEAFFHVACSGHEASAALAPHLLPQDRLHPHYRDKALLLARGVPLAEFFDGLLSSPAGLSRGRQMSAHVAAPALGVFSTVGPVGNSALQAVGAAQQLQAALPPGPAQRPIVLCSMGDGTTQQGEVMEAIAEAVRSALPVLFLVHDNGWSISTRTRGRTFFSLPDGAAREFFGLRIERLDGRDARRCQAGFGTQVARLRAGGAPALCVMTVERLSSHTNADDDSSYRSADERAAAWRDADPLALLRADLCANCGPDAIDDIDRSCLAAVRRAADAALARRGPRRVLPQPPATPAPVLTAAHPAAGSEPTQTMAMALRETLRRHLAADPRVTLYGQDIEDPKGDVFGLTAGLSTAFPGRVSNAPLSESTIVGTSIGRALAGGRPVAFLQFADFLPLAFNQLVTELNCIAWRTAGGWRAPVIVMVACGGYRPGLGPFHSHSFESVLAHVPGLDVVLPSCAADAASALDAAFASGEPTVIFYPKALLHDPARAATPPAPGSDPPLAQRGSARLVREGDALALVAWGNTVPLCEQVAATLGGHGVSVEVLDLRWISPWDEQAVLASARKCRRLIVVHEDNRRAGFGAEVLASVAEAAGGAVALARVARADEMLPCDAAQQFAMLPSFRSVLEAACTMLGLPLLWQAIDDGASSDKLVVPVIGSSPSDQRVELVELAVEVGQRVVAGQLLACVEADKAVAEIASPADGVVAEVHLRVGDSAAIGEPLLSLATGVVAAAESPRRFVPRIGPAAVTAPVAARATGATAVAFRALACVPGRARLANAELARHLAGQRDAAELLALTGIETRVVADDSQSVVSMALEAAQQALADAGVGDNLARLGLVLCATSTPDQAAPSIACRVLHALAPDAEVPAYDLSAACSGYLYALTAAWDFLQQQPDRLVLVLTSETLRRVVAIDDPDASLLFGDAASATVLGAASTGGAGLARVVQRPLIGAAGAGAPAMRLPLAGRGERVQMDGRKVFAEAVRRMGSALDEACQAAGIGVQQLVRVVPHQANGRILAALRNRLKLRDEQLRETIRSTGNTSSSSIPLALHGLLHPTAAHQPAGPMEHIGLCAFGAGWTWGAAVLERECAHAPAFAVGTDVVSERFRSA